MTRERLVPVAVYPVRGDAEIAKAHLASEGIEAVVVADDEGGLNPGFYARYGVRVLVRPDDLSAARSTIGLPLEPALHGQIVEAMIAHSRFCYPEEGCGLLAADDSGAIRFVYGLTNVDHSPSRFTVEPTEHYRAWKHAEANGWTIAGSFHSHPRSEPVPSPSDIAGALDPDWLYVVVGPVDGATEVRGFRIESGHVAEVPLEGVGYSRRP
jgi:proteasome lid subunit RPN8/RPN11